jgi:DNA helicase-2/ATP-dependent DNA helicase PcrA
LIASDELGKGPKQKLTVFRDLILDLMQAAGKLRASELARRTLEATGYETALRADDTAEADARLGNLEEAVGAIADYEQELEARGEAASIEGYLERVSLIANADTRLDTALVSLMTVHSAKGLEFGVVFLTGMEETIFPYRGVDQSHGDSEEDLDEERRLAYVAITRGKKRLFITHAQVRQLFGRTHYLSPSRFLDDLPASAVVREGRPGFGASPGRFGGGANYASRDFAPKSAPRLEPGMRIVVRDEAAVSSRDEGIEIVVRPGTRVNHRTFGRGIVESVESGERPIVVARFERVGRKRIQSDFLEFE